MAFLCGPAGGGMGYMPCSLCNDDLKVAAEVKQSFDLGNELRHLRADRRITVREAAKRYTDRYGAISLSEWSALETGRGKVSDVETAIAWMKGEQ